MSPDTAGLAYRSLEARWREVSDRVAAAAVAAGRDPAAPTVLAVTKGHPVEAITAALDIGVVDIGESRVQEAQAKRSALTDGRAIWHMVGHLQRNKARTASQLFDVVHSLDGVALAASLNRVHEGASAPLRVFIEVDLTGITGRSGVSAAQLPGLLDALTTLPNLQPVGLMTIAPPGPGTAARTCFARLRELRDQLADSQGRLLPELSMGMSDDFEAAVAEGSTIIRLGRVLFGTPPPMQPRGRAGLS